MRVVAVANQKGGVGKTTTVVNLGHALAQSGRRVLLADLDPQSHLAACMGMRNPDCIGMDSVLVHAGEMSDHVIGSRENLSLVPAGSGLGEFEYLEGGVERALVLRDSLAGVAASTDIVLLDCAPSTGMLMVNAIAAADDVLIPVAGDYLSLTGLARLMLTLKRLQALRKKGSREWMFFSRFTPRRRLSQEVYAKVMKHFPRHLLCGAIQEAAALAECAGAGKSIFEYRRSSRSAREFTALANDLLNERVVGNERGTSSHVA